MIGRTCYTMGGKRPKESESKQEADFDRLSQLPDDILHKILSFFPQENLGKTLFLSKRWLNLWTTTLPFLCFKFTSETETNARLLNFAEKALSSRDKSTFIERFSLSSRPSSSLDTARVNLLIRDVVIRRRVCELDLKLYNCRVQFCSPFFVSSKLLTSLKLWCDDSEPFPSSFFFPNLKTMELTNLVLRENFASQISNNCGKLENLSITVCRFVENLYPYDDSCSLGILPNLNRASILLDNDYEETRVFDLLRVISNVEVLSLKVDYSTLLLEQLKKMDYFSEFHNLKSLEFGEFFGTEEAGGGGVSIMDSMLRSLPVLESLDIDFVMYFEESEDGTGLPNCRLSERLKVIKLGGVYPDNHLIEIVKYFLDEAKGLEKMIVCKPMYRQQKEVDDICLKLQALPNSGALELCEDDTRS